MGNAYNILCHVEDTISADSLSLADSKDNLQRLLHTFNQEAKILLNMLIPNKTKCMVAAKDSIRCKLNVNGQMIEKISKLRYMRTRNN